MAVPVKDDEGLVGKPIRGVINFEGRTHDDCLKALTQAYEQIERGFDRGSNYIRGKNWLDVEEDEVGYYSFEVDGPDGN